MDIASKLGEVATVRAGYTFRSAPTFSTTSDIRLVQAKDIDKWIVLDNPKPLPSVSLPKTSHSFLQVSDILLSSRGRFHATVVTNSEVPIIASSSLYILTPYEKTGYSPQFIAMYINSSVAQSHFTKYSTGSNIKTLLIETVKELPLPNIGWEEQNSLLEFYNTMVGQIELLKQKRELIDQIFRATLSNAFEGALA